MLQMNVNIYYKTLSNRIRTQKSAFENKKLRTPYCIARGDLRETIKVMKVLRVKYAPAIGIAKGLMTYNES